MKPSSILLPAILLLGLTASGPAFPPAPYYTLYGTVRDQSGQVLTAAGAQVILLKGAVEAGRAAINSGLQLDQNYELPIRIDQARPSTSLYTASAVAAQGQFSLVVDIGGQKFYPIEVKGTLTAGKGTERVRLDLTLGEDLDHDGLPDAWEQWQLYQAGLYPDENGWDLSKLDRNGDFDGDGQSNWAEYLAGTFATDATERFDLKIKTKSATDAAFEFFGITGKTYTIESSTDGQKWTRVPLSTGATSAERSPSFQAASVGIIKAFVSPAPGASTEFFRLTVR